MKLRRFVREGDMIPRGYGVAWRDPVRWGAVCYPFPFHKPIGWLRRWYWDVVRPPRSPHCDRLKLQISDLERELRTAQGHAEALVGELRLYKRRDREDEAWALELFKTVRHLRPLD